MTSEPRAGQGLDWLRRARPAAILEGLATPAPACARSRRPSGIDRPSSQVCREGSAAGAALGGNGYDDSGADPAQAQGGNGGSGVAQEVEAASAASMKARGRKQAQRPQRSRRHRDKR